LNYAVVSAGCLQTHIWLGLIVALPGARSVVAEYIMYKYVVAALAAAVVCLISY